MENIIIERLNTLRTLMKKNNLDAYIIPTNDFHGSEYVGDYFKTRSFISGFTGSAGTVVVTLDEAILWTDGRYFLQAEEQLKNSTIELYKQGEKGVLNIYEYLNQKMPSVCNIGFDGRVVSINFVEELKRALKSHSLTISYQEDLIDKIWTNRPSISKEPAYELGFEFTGLNRFDKLNIVKEYLKDKNATALVLTSLDDIMWLFNIRGNDVECNPVVLSYSIIYQDKTVLYLHKEVLNESLYKTLVNDNIIIKDYNDIYTDVTTFDESNTVIYQNNKVNFALSALISTNKVINELNYTTILKACKNECEVKNAYIAHIKDGVAVTKFIFWLKQNVGKINISEISAAEKLEAFRKEQENFKGVSFDTIAGYKEHGAIIHYSATEETNILVHPESFLLVDSGGQYLEGTTDITRTIAVGKLTDKEKDYYTIVLKGHLALSNAVFKEGTSGSQLDILARLPLYQYGLNYNHGTGHGVGSLLNVHEGPQNISPYPQRASYPFKEGMITSNEPGIYIPNEFGIRIENLVVCTKHIENEFGLFYKFDDLTLVPYEIDALNKSLLTSEEINLIHKYHERVYNTLEKYLTKEEKEWLLSIVEAI